MCVCGLCYPVLLGDGLGCDKLPAHMVLSLSHLALVCLSLQAQTPFSSAHPQPAVPPIRALSPSLIWTIRAKTGEASFLCAHPTSPLSFSVISLPTPSVHSSISLLSHADNPSGLVVDGGVNSALWRCLKGFLLYMSVCLSGWLHASWWWSLFFRSFNPSIHPSIYLCFAACPSLINNKWKISS